MATIGFLLDTRNIQPDEYRIYLPLGSDKQKYLQQISDCYCLGDEGRSTCEKIGQNIFDRYKKFAGENSLIGIMALDRIYSGIDTNKLENKNFRHFVDKAWDGVGDANYTWVYGVQPLLS